MKTLIISSALILSGTVYAGTFNSPFEVGNPDLYTGVNFAVVKELQKDEKRLQISSSELIEIRCDAERWFPALRLMRSEMLPHSQQLLSQLDLCSLILTMI